MRFHKLEAALEAAAGPDRAAVLALRAIRESQKFYGGAVDVLPDFPGGKLYSADFPPLPFPDAAFEVEDAEGRSIIVLCTEDCGRVFAHPFYSDDHSREQWHASGIVLVDRAACTVDYRAFKTFSEGGKDWAFKCVYLAARLVSVLNCVNVETQVVDAPIALNKKRLSKGKVPVYSYKVLVLRRKTQRLSDASGTHLSPRVHLRRGHIKHRKTGSFWWQPHVVGDRSRGVVMKDYRADKLLRA